MSGGIDWKNLLGSRGPQSVTASQAAAQGKIPWHTVTNPTMMSQPYPDRILKIQAAKNLGYDPNFQPDLSGVAPPRRASVAAAMRANEALSPWGMNAAKGARGLAGEQTEFDYMASELDAAWMQDAIASAIPSGDDPSLPAAPTRGGTTGQPKPGSFETTIPQPSPIIKKKRTLEEIGLLA